MDVLAKIDDISDKLNDKLGSYGTETSRGMQELCLDFEWLITMVEESKEFVEWAIDVSTDIRIVKRGEKLLKKF